MLQNLLTTDLIGLTNDELYSAIAFATAQPARFARKKFAPSAFANENFSPAEICVAERSVHQSRAQKISSLQVGPTQEHPTEVNVLPLPSE
jgi:hypothetical protein